MDKEQWTRRLITNLASGHMNDVIRKEASDWLQGFDPPIDDDWEPKAVKEFKDRKSEDR